MSLAHDVADGVLTPNSIVKQKLAKKARQNRPIPQWFRLKTDSES